MKTIIAYLLVTRSLDHSELDWRRLPFPRRKTQMKQTYQKGERHTTLASHGRPYSCLHLYKLTTSVGQPCDTRPHLPSPPTSLASPLPTHLTTTSPPHPPHYHLPSWECHRVCWPQVLHKLAHELIPRQLLRVIPALAMEEGAQCGIHPHFSRRGVGRTRGVEEEEHGR